VHKKMR